MNINKYNYIYIYNNLHHLKRKNEIYYYNILIIIKFSQTFAKKKNKKL